MRRFLTKPAAIAWSAGLLVLVVMLATEGSLAIGWDEGYTLGRQARLRLWFRALADPDAFARTWTPPTEEFVQQEGAPPPTREQVDTRRELLTDPATLAWFWPFAREEPHGHPPFYALLGLVGDVIAPQWSDLSRARLGPILLFSIAAGALVGTILPRWGPWAALTAVAAWLLQPRLFAEAHYATYDGILTSLWMLSTLVFLRIVEAPPGRWKPLPWVLSWGVLVGCAMATKLTGWFLPIPFGIWALLHRDRRVLAHLFVGGLVALGTVWFCNPPWWSEPILGPLRFFQSNLTRGQSQPIAVEFLGKVYRTPNESLPWYNTLVWVAFVTPVGFLVLALIGTGAVLLRRVRGPLGDLLVLHLALLLALRSLPHTPGHDGVRMFLAAFGAIAGLAGLGASMVTKAFSRLGRFLVGATLIEGVVGLAIIMPVPLSYYSPLVGGLPGATGLGMEATYFWDALTPELRSWLATNTHEGETIQFATFPRSFLYLRREGDLPRRIAQVDPGQPVWYVLQNRPGAFWPWDRSLVREAKPAATVTKLGVPLVWVFPYSEFEKRWRKSR